MSEFSSLHAVMTHPSMVDYPGRMAVLFFTNGCNFHCGFCHNPDLIGFQENVKNYTWKELEVFCERYRKQWVHAVTITGGEPTIHPALGETIDFFKSHGFSVKLDTNGSNPEMLEKLLPRVDYVAMDIKCRLEKYSEFVGYPAIERIQESIAFLMASSVDYEFRTTLVEGIPGIHDDEDLLATAEEIRGAKHWIFQSFVPHDNLPGVVFRSLERTRPSTLHHAVELVSPYVVEASARGE